MANVMIRRRTRVRRPARLRVGDRVRVPYASTSGMITAVVIEDRGDIGVNGRQLVRIEIRIGKDCVSRFEMPAEEVGRAAKRRPKRAPLDKRAAR